MNYSAEETGKIIKREREKRGWTQKILGENLGITGKQISNYESGVLMPPIDILSNLCRIFDCELGFLLGEENYAVGTKFYTAVEDTLGLNLQSIQALEYIVGKDSSSLLFGYEYKQTRRILNMLISSPSFRDFFECLVDLDRHVEYRKTVLANLEKKYSKELVDQALGYYNSTVDYLYDSDTEKLDDIMYEIMIEIDHAISKSDAISYDIKVARYELNESFLSLINSIYPKGE